MCGQNGDLTGQKIHSLVLLTSDTHEHFLKHSLSWTTAGFPLLKLRFCVFVKVLSPSKIKKYTRISKLVYQIFLAGQKQDLTERDFLWLVAVPSHRPKIPWALNFVICNLQHPDKYHSISDKSEKLELFLHLSVLHDICKWFIISVVSDFRNLILKSIPPSNKCCPWMITTLEN